MQHQMSLFVYGSLSSGMVHFEKIRGFITASQAASISGFVYRLPVGYPVYLSRDISGASENSVQIHGQLVSLDGPDVAFRILDEFHGYSPLVPDKSLFWKEKVFAETQSGVVEAEVYALNPSKLPRGSELIGDGDWQRELSLRPALPAILTERQSTYVKKLNASTGREIVPIDLQLYRELLKLDLIVDKGRRLALTKLGKEVARYLS